MTIKTIASLSLIVTIMFSAASRGSEAPAPAAAAPAASSASAPVDPAVAASTEALKTQLQAIMDKVQVKINQGKHDEADFAPELADFDALIAAHKNEKTDAVAFANYAKDVLYFEIFDDPTKGLAGYKQIVQDYPGTNTAQEIAKMLVQLEPQVQVAIAAQAARKDLVVGKPFPDFAVKNGTVKDIDGKPLSLSQYKGKVVLVDFWATWCQPCMDEMPNVIAAYDKYHSQGFDIVGISLDRPDGQATLPQFLAAHKMPWRQFCDGQYWQNELAIKYGISEIPWSYLLDGTGKIIAICPRGPELAPAIAAALAAAKS